MNTQVKESMVSFSTSRFGEICVGEDKVVNFVKGIPGFDGLRRFIIIDHDQEGVFRWLQSVDNPSVAFLLTDPNLFKPGYSVPLRKGEAEALGAKDPSGLVTYVMVCASRENAQMSINLKGPVIFNSDNMRAMQCIIDRDDYQSHFAVRL